MHRTRSISIQYLASILFLVLLPSGLTHAQKVNKEFFELEKQVVATVTQTKESVIAIVMKDAYGMTVGSGSGVIVSEDGLVFTAAHVVDGFTEVTAILSDQSEHRLKVLGMNRYKDAAVCQLLEERSWPFANIGDSDNLEVTDWVITMGHGRGYDKTRTPPVRFGRVRAHNPGRFLTSDCPLIGGDSGGPLFDLDGNVIAINSSINGLSKFNVHAGVSGFKDDLERLLKGEVWGQLIPNVLYTPETPVLGVGWVNSRSYYRIRDPRPIVGTIYEGPAYEAGIRPGDMIRKVADEVVTTTDDVAIALGRQRVGEQIQITYQRQNKLYTTEVILKSRLDLNGNPYDITVPELAIDDDSPYVKASDKPKLLESRLKLFQWLSPLDSQLSDSFIQLYSPADISTPLLHATVISDGLALTPYSALKGREHNLIAWRPGIDSHRIKLKGVYLEHDLAVIEIPGLKTNLPLLKQQKEVNLGEFLFTMSQSHGVNSASKIGVVSVEKRNLKAFFGVGSSHRRHPKGTIIGSVSKGKAAYNMGLRPGDIITSFNGVETPNFTDLIKVIDALTVGEEITVCFIRNNREFTCETRLGGKGDNSEKIAQMDQLGRNNLSLNRSSFKTVIQSDLLVAPEECGAPVFALDGMFVGIAISDAGRNKSYIVPASAISDAFKSPPTLPKEDHKTSYLAPSSSPLNFRRDNTFHNTPRPEPYTSEIFRIFEHFLNR